MGHPEPLLGTDGHPTECRQPQQTPFHRRLPSLGGPQLLLAQPRLLVDVLADNMIASKFLIFERWLIGVRELVAWAYLSLIHI